MEIEGPQYVIIMTAALPLVTQFLKKLWPKTDPRCFSIGFSVFAGLLYALSKEFVPIDFLARWSGVAMVAFGIGTAIYQVQKPRKK